MLERAFDIPVGFSDHSEGTAIPLAAIALGACAIEKHFTLDHSMEGWDHWISANPEEFGHLTKNGSKIFKALGKATRIVGKDEQAQKLAFRRCCVAAKSLPAGHVLSLEDLDYKRPGNGIHPDESEYLVGRTLKRDVADDDAFSWDDLV